MNEIRVSCVFVILLFMFSIIENTIVTKEWVVVVSVSKWYDEIFQNWLLWYKRLNLEMKTIVIAEDLPTYEKYKNFSDFTTMHFELEEVSVCFAH